MREADGNTRTAISFSVRSKKPKSGSIKFETIKPTYPSRCNSGLSHQFERVETIIGYSKG